MTRLREILAFNMREKRRILGISQAKLARKAGISTQFVAMIELEKKFPSPEMLERLAAALEIDPPELFSMPPSPAGTLRKLHETVLADIEQAAGTAATQAVQEAVRRVIAEHVKELEGEGDMP
jgi:transcriptional regulator with XRE-family HTH domain